jgi:hypothetical protein
MPCLLSDLRRYLTPNVRYASWCAVFDDECVLRERVRNLHTITDPPLYVLWHDMSRTSLALFAQQLPVMRLWIIAWPRVPM